MPDWDKLLQGWIWKPQTVDPDILETLLYIYHRKCCTPPPQLRQKIRLVSWCLFLILNFFTSPHFLKASWFFLHFLDCFIPWFHYSLIFWFLKFLLSCLFDLMISWYFDILISWFSWFLDFLIFRFLDLLIPWFLDFLIPWFLDLFIP